MSKRLYADYLPEAIDKAKTLFGVRLQQ